MKGIRIRPEQQGLRTSLFDLEAEIMEIVWDEGWEEFAVADVHRILETQREIAYTTVMTTISRLYDKDLLTRRKEGRRYLYTAIMSRTEFIEAMTREVLESLPPVGQKAAIALLVERVAQADHDELDRLEALIRKRRKHDE
ncbi:BlaI/MecI/CopY family transcriptional regulator [Lujinxingia vulgaris]|uniref:BlaI/MecI/CopY family transcriptional regulator n=1 Tax=Lujinxingia vulgaris TaxID=2600176 RepID=A0A5C6X8K3_9DELT|nr:BlaI/MecI/CopY family transcriptional regulator [Lujinxingia vulgaris]TXD35030.1 BlaI/MecI/CopY family transcriptional regulator [Lujinxingia vulgaris]